MIAQSAARILLPRAARRDLRLAIRWVDSVGERTRAAFKKSGAAFRDETARLQLEANALADNDSSPFGKLIQRHGIPRRRLATIVDGWNAFYIRGVSRDARQLDALLRQWAGAPMLLIVEVLSNGHELAPESSRAMQSLGMAHGLLTLLLRLEDELHDARYVFPLDEIERFNVTREDLAARRRPPGFHDLCWFQLQRSREWIAKGNDAIPQLPTPSAQRIARFMVAWCEHVATRIEQGGYPLMGEARAKARMEPTWMQTVRMAWSATAPHKRT